jgi:hypothetical protein
VDQERYTVSTLVEAMTRLMVQKSVVGEAGASRGRYRRRSND